MCKEVYDTLVEWTGKGMIAVKELRAITGRLSWMAGILPRLRWTTSVFYAVITDAMHDIETGQELKRAKGRDGDQRPKVGLVAVKRLGAALNWLIAMLESCPKKKAMEAPLLGLASTSPNKTWPQ